MDESLPELIPISKIRKESLRVTSYFFKKKLGSLPGQFIMLWVPGVGERPVAVYEDKEGLRISVAKVGTVSMALSQMKVGERVGIRGPYGTSFTLPAKKGDLVMVAGGYGIVPLAYFATLAVKKGHKVTILNGARTAVEALYQDFFEKRKIKMLISTDDGSCGRKGFVHELLVDYLKENMPTLQSASRPEGVGKKPVMVYTCGPEIMEYRIAKVCWENKISFQVSIERYMKCGIGVCGSCCVDPTGLRMCVEGPIIDGRDLKKITEFGKYHRSASGVPVYFKNV